MFPVPEHMTSHNNSDINHQAWNEGTVRNQIGTQCLKITDLL
jgi:hypothetical protein